MIAPVQPDVGRSRRLISQPPSDQLFLVISGLLFIASATVTIARCTSMSEMPTLPMPGDWKMSMAWMRMPGQTWLVAAASFLGMWIIMMLAMMLPSLVQMLQRYRESIVGAGETHLGRLTAMVGVGYFAVWTVLGVVLFPLGVVLASLEMRSQLLSRAIPAASGVGIIIGGAVQFTRWKVRHLALCREAAPRGCRPAAHSRGALRYGLHLGLHCSYCCVGLTAMLLAIGVMDSRAMVLVAGAITAERLAPSGQRVARAIGVVALGVGVFLLARAITLA